MDALEFLKERKRMCTSFKGCDGCPLAGTHCVLSYATDDEDYERIIATVEQWSKGHPRKTRQSVFLEQWPNAVINNGVLNLTPCNIDRSLYDIQRCNGADCSKCRREFWMQEVE